MAIPNATKLAASNAVAALGSWVSLHTGAGGGTTGANEATGGGYGRVQCTWTPGTTSNTGNPVNVPCGAGTYTEGGIWSAQNAGTFVGSGPFSGGSVIVSGTGASVTVTASNTQA